jgi:hypothetical protein
MTQHTMRDAVVARFGTPLPGWVRPLLLVCTLAGAAGFLALAVGSGADRAWRIYHLNWLYWTGLALGGVLFSAVTTVAKGKWAFPVRRIGEASVAFLPLSLALFAGLWVGRGHIFPWIAHPITDLPVKAFWLRDWFLFTRDLAGLLLLFGLAIWYVVHSVRPDAAALLASAPHKAKALYERLTEGWEAKGADFSDERREQIAPALILTYAVVMSLIAFDMIMSLAPYWLSNLLGGFFFMGAWLTGLTTITLLVLFFRRHLGLEDVLSEEHLHDLGKLVFGFTVFWAYLFFSQFLVIWYGNLPEETSFLYLRMSEPEWQGISAAMLVLTFLLPFWGLIGIRPKRTPAILGTFAAISLLGVWVDRYVLVVPSIVQEAEHLPLGWQELLITLGFFGLWGLAYVWFVERFPVVSPHYVAKMPVPGRH